MFNLLPFNYVFEIELIEEGFQIAHLGFVIRTGKDQGHSAIEGIILNAGNGICNFGIHATSNQLLGACSNDGIAVVVRVEIRITALHNNLRNVRAVLERVYSNL